MLNGVRSWPVSLDRRSTRLADDSGNAHPPHDPSASREFLRQAICKENRACEESTLTAFLDTNVVIRHLTGDPPEMARRATRVPAQPEPLLLADMIVAECVYVLESFYEVPRPRVAELMRAALALPCIEPIDLERRQPTVAGSPSHRSAFT